jgi:hypothetical protein
MRKYTSNLLLIVLDLSQPITVGQVIVTLDGRNKEQFAFEAANVTLQPGSNEVNLICSVSNHLQGLVLS